MKRAFKGVWIPKEIWLSKDLTLQEKVFLVEIDSLDNKDGCFASNGHFSDFFGLSKNRCSEVIKSLEEKGFITTEYIRGEGQKNIEKRVLRVIGKPNRGIRETEGSIRKVEGGYSGKCEGSNTLLINTTNNTSHKYKTCDMENAELLFKRIKEHYPRAKKPNLKSWADTIRLMREVDRIPSDEIKEMIEFCQKHPFWYKNVRSAEKLRKQYERLYLEKRDNKPNNIPPKPKGEDPALLKLRRLQEEANAR